jgi:hypothetical protein
MPTPTYDLIASNVLGSSAASVTFSSISGSYRDLVLSIVADGTSAASLRLQFNTDTGSNYNWLSAYGTGSSTGSQSGASQTDMRIATAAYFDTANQLQVRATVLDYSATDKHKAVLSRADSASDGQATEMIAGRWASTSAITEVKLFPNAGSFEAGSSFYLYGIVS